VITGAKKLDHLLSNVRAWNWKLSSEELEEVEGILKPAPTC
jgi:aryl-alcohol dehydrogenase-like predicted oxidoreductase